MGEDSAALSGPIRVDEKQLWGHIDEVVRSSLEGTLNALLDAEADRICGAGRYERSVDRVDTRRPITIGSCRGRLARASCGSRSYGTCRLTRRLSNATVVSDGPDMNTLFYARHRWRSEGVNAKRNSGTDQGEQFDGVWKIWQSKRT
jgi:hypothetical protein